MAEKRSNLPKKVEECAGGAPPQQGNEMEQLQLLQKDAGRDPTKEQNSARSSWCFIGQMFTNKGAWCRDMITMLTKREAKPDPAPTQSIAPAPSMDSFGDRIVSSPDQVPGFVRYTHQRLMSSEAPDDRLFMDILRLTDAHPTDVAVTLLRCAPSCDRFAMQTLRALFHHLQCVHLVVAMERKCGWDTLLCVDTHHYAVGLLAREMRRVSIPLCSCIALRLLRLLNQEEPRWELAAMAFLVEVLECLDLNERGENLLEIMTKHLKSESKEECHLALRGLVVLSQDPLMTKKMCSLSASLVQLLKNADGEDIRLTLTVFKNMLLKKDILVSSPTAPKLAEALRPLFDNDNSHIQLLSIQLYQEVMELVVEEGKKPLKVLVSESLLPLFFYCHSENRRVAESARETLLAALSFLNRKDLKHLLKTEDPWSFGERVLAEDRSQAGKHLRQALPYLESPEEPVREAAIRSIGIASMLMKGQQEELEIICEALQALSQDESPSKRNLIVQVMLDERAASLNSSSASRQPGQHQIPSKRRQPGAPGTADAGHS
ncbi:maestro heat-like repeat-containing protein family member 7 [Poecile atricapillus]|uniref:maestro heat-like repeat-containing protein family member 7 n=1 Tax=Poecile atricapillus TaxID=48891 RepID=UPI0027392107|nr:maestro heat-like repeat-containing protein family member 7 [Poecile atricapillus]